MKKLGLIVLVAGIILMAGCAGDDPAGPSGTLPTVTGLEILASSAGRTVNLSWTAVTSTDIDGYKVYFRATTTGEWTVVATVTSGTDGTHAEATSSGYYTVKAYKDDDYSQDNSNIKDTMPEQIAASYTIWDNHAPPDSTSGIYFEDDGGHRVLAATSTLHDIYCYDGGWSQSPCGFYSGNLMPFGTGHTTYMIDAGTTYGYPAGTYPGDYWDNGYMEAGDVIFLKLDNGYYVKVYVSAIPQCPAQPLSHGVTLYFDYQPIEGLYLFTTASN